MKKIAGGLMAALLLFGVAGCSGYNDHRGKGDAPVAGRHGDDSPADVVNMPDSFPNISTKCLKGRAPWAAAVTTDRILSNDEHELLTVTEVAKLLRLSGPTVRRLVKSGELEAIRPGRSYRIKAASVTRLLERAA